MRAKLHLLFELKARRPIPRFPKDPKGNARAPDGLKFMSVRAASAKYGRPEPDLRRHWIRSVGPYLSHDDRKALRITRELEAML